MKFKDFHVYGNPLNLNPTMNKFMLRIHKNLMVLLNHSFKSQYLLSMPNDTIMLICLTLPPLSSLNNQSDKVRWSLDLRWQRVDKPVGFFGLKEGVQMRSSTDPNFKINWEGFNALDRHEEAAKHLDRVTYHTYDN